MKKEEEEELRLAVLKFSALRVFNSFLNLLKIK